MFQQEADARHIIVIRKIMQRRELMPRAIYITATLVNDEDLMADNHYPYDLAHYKKGKKFIVKAMGEQSCELKNIYEVQTE